MPPPSAARRREGDLVVVDVLAQAVLAGDDDRDGAPVARPQDGPWTAVADDRGREPMAAWRASNSR